MRLIDADALIDAFDKADYDVSQMYGDDGFTYKTVEKLIESAPTIERPKGKWMCHDGSPLIKCSHCGSLINTLPSVGDDIFIDYYEYCPHCGANMREKQNEQTD